MSDIVAARNVGSARSTRAWSAVHIVAGTLLVVAALLKAYQTAMPGPAVPWHLRLWELAVIEFELMVGSMLLLNVWPTTAWGLAIAAYTIFAGVSVQKVMAGAKSCGCFGPAAVNPRVMVGIDAVMIVLLFVAGPRLVSAARRGALARVGGIVAIVLMLAAAGAIAFAAVPKRGLVPEGNGSHDFGVVTSAAAKNCEHVFVVRNTSASPVRIIGSKSSCGCTVAQLPPTAIAPGGWAEVIVRADWANVLGTTASQVTLETDNRSTPRVALVVSANVVAASP